MDRKMKAVLALAVVAALGFGCEMGSAPKPAEEKAADEGLPAAVSDAIAKAYPGAQIVEFESEVEDGETVYEVEILVDGKEMDVEVSADGKVLDVEEDDADDDADEDDDEDDDDDDADDDDAEDDD